VAISPDGKQLVTGSWDNSARLWDLTAAEPEKTARVLAGHTSNVNAVAISPDGRRLVTGSADGTARIWPLPIEEVLDQAERAVGRNFTREEWKELFPDEPYRKTFERLPAPPEEPPTPQ
jgi:WD40 repeat protein